MRLGLAVCLLALPPASFAAGLQGGVREAPSAQAVDRAIERAVAHLRERYADGMGRDAQLGAPSASLVDHPGLRALTAFALLRSGVPRDDAVVEALLARLALERCATTYDSACVLLALAAYDPVGERGWIEELAADLVAWQEEAGDWGYPEGGDLSNTQYAALALHAAADAGVAIPTATWRRLADSLARYRKASGGFTYVPRGRRPTGSMTTAAVGTLALCELELAAAGALDADRADALRVQREGGLAWLAEHFEADHNPGLGSWTHYYLYGLERVGAFAGVERIGARDWYAEGARWLIDTQDGGGTWPGTFERLPTLYALLFLRRASRPRAPETPGAGGVAVEAAVRPRALEPDALRLRVESLDPLTLSLAGWDAARRADATWAGEAVRGPRVLRVVYEADGAPFAALLGDRTRPVDGREFRVETRRLPAGVHTVRARVTVALPPAEEAEAQRPAPTRARPRTGELLSREVTLVLDAEAGRPEGSALAARPTNLLPTGRPRAEASSTLADGRAWSQYGVEPARAVDDNPRSPWFAEVDDAEPVLDLRLRRPQVADRVVIHAARVVPRAPRGMPAVAVAVRVGVRVNDGDERFVALSPAGQAPARLELDAPVRVRRLELRLERRSPAAAAPETVGIGEVELFLSTLDRAPRARR